GLRRAPDETLVEFAHRAGRRAGELLGDRQVASGLDEVAAAATEAAFRAGPLDPARAGAAVQLAERIDGALHHAAPASQRLRRMVDLRAAWRPAEL
ncbi:MAG TPA: hypothetical protein VFP61_04685, partial [Acidimicrobiales bacterium]|nr:hypothetical protein [Acidimicrobiales bacterium]